MRTPKLLQNHFLRAAATIGSAFLLAAPHPHQDIDPSLLAAEPYNPELWNGEVSNEYLIHVYNNHRELIDDMSLRYQIFTPHPAHRALDMPLALSSVLANMRRDYNQSDADFIYGLSYQFHVSVYEFSSLYNDLKRISSQLQFQDDANCYSYAVNDHDNLFYGVTTGTRGWDASQNQNALTHRYRSPNLYPQFVNATIAGAISDGSILTNKTQMSRAGYYRVALFTGIIDSTQNDYNEFHWARQNRDGTWSHKMANLNVTNLDFAGNIITDPARADFGDYRFVGYFLVPRGGINVGPYYDSSRTGGATTSAPQPAPQTQRHIIVTAPRQP